MRTGNNWFVSNDSSEESPSEESHDSDTMPDETITPVESAAETSSSDACSTDKVGYASFVHIEDQLPSIETTVALIKSRVNRLRSEFLLFNERMERMRLMQQVIMRAVVDQGVTSKTNRAYSVIYVIDGQATDDRRDITRLDGKTLMGLLTLDRDLLSSIKVYPMGMGYEERDYIPSLVTLDYTKDGVDGSMTVTLVRDKHGDYVFDFTDSVWPDQDSEQLEFSFSRSLELEPGV